jgi:hypothetical protein
MGRPVTPHERDLLAREAMSVEQIESSFQKVRDIMAEGRIITALVVYDTLPTSGQETVVALTAEGQS